jgi:L-amino acid N-acyltransferase YncA
MAKAVKQKVQVKPAIRIRQASDADRSAILAMYADFDRAGLSVGMPPSTDIADWLDGLATSQNLVAVEEDRVIGHGFVRPEDGTGEVAVYVHQSARRRGIGRRLLNTVIEEARHQHLNRIWGMTEAANEPMLRLARSLGFVQANDPNMFWLTLEPPDESRLVITSPPLPQA